MSGDLRYMHEKIVERRGYCVVEGPVTREVLVNLPLSEEGRL